MSLEVRGLRKSRGGRRVLDALDLVAAAAAITCIRGANGSGKSTLLGIIAGVLAPDRGTVELAGKSLLRRRARRDLGYVPEAADPPAHLSCDELLTLVAALKQAPAPDAALRARLGVDALAGHRIERMSLGERRRTCLAAALIGEPSLLVLDEPTNGLDAAGVDMLVELLCERRDAGAVVLLASHDHDFIGRVDARVFELQSGRLRTETTAESHASEG